MRKRQRERERDGVDEDEAGVIEIEERVKREEKTKNLICIKYKECLYAAPPPNTHTTKTPNSQLIGYGSSG